MTSIVQTFYHLADTTVKPRVFERVSPIKFQKVSECGVNSIVGRGASHRLSNQDRSTVADIRIDDPRFERRKIEMRARGIRRDGQIAAGIYQSPVKIEDDKQFPFSTIVRAESLETSK